MKYLLFFAFLVPALIIARKHSQFIFWLSLISLIDMGGYVYAVDSLDENIIKLPFLIHRDAFFISMLLPVLFLKKKGKEKSRDIRLIFTSFLLFYLYYIFIYGILTTQFENMKDLFKLRKMFLAPLVFLVTFQIVRHKPEIFYKLYPKVVSIFLIAFYITILTPINIINVFSSERLGSERIILSGLSFIIVFIYWGLLDFLINKKKHKRIIAISILTLFSIIIGLTRQLLVEVSVSVILIIMIVKKIKRQNLGYLIKILFTLVLLFSMFYISFPRYFQSINTLFIDTYKAFRGERDTEITLHRMDAEVPLHLKLFKSNLLFGTGFDHNWYYNELSIGHYGGPDVPATAMLGMIGIVGTTFYFTFKMLLLYLLVRINRFLYLNYHYLKNNGKTDSMIMMITSSIFILFKIFFVFDWFSEFIILKKATIYFFNLGLLLAQYSYCREFVLKNKRNYNDL